MLSIKSLAAVAGLLHITHSSPVVPRSSSISWGACNNASIVSETLQCAQFNVPLDYTTPGTELTLSLYRVPALKQPAKGTIFLNFGGPGSPSGNSMARPEKAPWPLLSNGEYDFVSFDPRGTGDTISFNCATRNSSQTFDFYPAITIPEKWDAATKQAKDCSQSPYGQYIGTVAFVRDIISLADALGIQSINYWGFSYGTALGATLALMFPDRVGKVILDGNINLAEYWDGRQPEQYIDAAGAFEGFFTACVANPQSCALVTRTTSTVSQIKAKVLTLYKIKPTDTADIITARRKLAAEFLDIMYSPSSWSDYAQALQYQLEPDSVPQPKPVTPNNIPPFPDQGADALNGISFSDSGYRTNSVDEIISIAAANSPYDPAYSDLVNGDAMIILTAQWPFLARERFTGPWRAATKTPVLLIGNSFDPVTPLASARNNSAMFKDSVVLHQDSYGHCSSAQPSLCTARYIMAYWRNGTLPPKDTVCGASVPLFRNLTSRDFLDELRNGSISVDASSNAATASSNSGGSSLGSSESTTASNTSAAKNAGSGLTAPLSVSTATLAVGFWLMMQV